MSALDAVAPFVPLVARRRSLHEPAALTEWLYQRLFIDWRPPTGRFAHDVAGAPWFVEQLRARAGHASYLQPGFRLAQRAPGGTFVENDHLRLFITDPRALVGRGRLSVRVPCAREALAPGFFSFVSRAGRLPEGADLKLYVNVTPAGALALVEALLHDRALREARFEAKVVNDPGAFGRRDTALLYVEPASWRRVVRWLRAFSARHRRLFRTGTPPLTLPLGRSISAAESPAGGDSFGVHRCQLIAAGLLRGGDWRAQIAAAFSEVGLDAAAPWLGSLPADWTEL